MKGKLLIFIALVLVVVLSVALVGCEETYTEDEYNEVVEERDACLDQVTALQNNLAECQGNITNAAAYAEFMAFWMGERPETPEERQAYGMEMASKLAALDDAALSAMFDELTQAAEVLMAQGLTEEEMMMEIMDDYMAVLSYMMDKIAEALGVEQ